MILLAVELMGVSTKSNKHVRNGVRLVALMPTHASVPFMSVLVIDLNDSGGKISPGIRSVQTLNFLLVCVTGAF